MISASVAKKDLVLRNAKVDPPVAKIMHYKMELLKRLFKKLGAQVKEKEAKSKTIRLSTTISMHDLENKKKKAIEYLKQNSAVKFYMKVNVYDDENVQKGKLILTNIAEDLKEYAKVRVAPMQKVTKEDLPAQEEVKLPKSARKGDKTEELKKMADKSRKAKDTMYSVDDSDDEDEDPESRSNNIYMELGSTVAFKEIDIDEMLQHTTLDDFLRGMYTN